MVGPLGVIGEGAFLDLSILAVVSILEDPEIGVPLSRAR